MEGIFFSLLSYLFYNHLPTFIWGPTLTQFAIQLFNQQAILECPLNGTPMVPKGRNVPSERSPSPTQHSLYSSRWHQAHVSRVNRPTSTSITKSFSCLLFQSFANENFQLYSGREFNTDSEPHLYPSQL